MAARRDGESPEEILALVQKLMKERTDRLGSRAGRSGVSPDLTTVLGDDPVPGSASANQGSVAYVPAIPAAIIDQNRTLHILSARMVRGWTYGAQSPNPPPPMTTGSAYDGFTGNFQGLIR